MPSIEKEIRTGWESPSNIALIKYWGKKGNQIPMNPSLSMTLEKSVTRTLLTIRTSVSPVDEIRLNFSFEGSENPAFAQKVSKYLTIVSEELPFLKGSEITIETTNTFPHSAGIASSASAMSALALCLVTAELTIHGAQMPPEKFLHRASYLARLGSGSASRSVYGGFVTWGRIRGIIRSGDEFATPLARPVHPIYQGLRDTILVISNQRKQVSSSAGHERMADHPFREARIKQAIKNLNEMLAALHQGDWKLFSKVAESEALTLHALMMSADEGFTLLLPETLKAIDLIRRFRAETGNRLTFTIDAGPNIHLIYPDEDASQIEAFIQQELSPLAQSGILYDRLGNGPQKIKL